MNFHTLKNVCCAATGHQVIFKQGRATTIRVQYNRLETVSDSVIVNVPVQGPIVHDLPDSRLYSFSGDTNSAVAYQIVMNIHIKGWFTEPYGCYHRINRTPDIN